MSKAILVIDMPNLESHEIDSYDMVADLKVKSLVLGGERYDFELKNVIIKPMPKKMLALAHIQNGIVINKEDMKYMAGRNNCIDELLGEEE